MKERLLLSLLLAQVPATAGGAATIDHGGVACVVAGKFPKIEARITPAERVAKARTFFHADDDTRWYYVEMKAEGGAFYGVLPQPLKTTKRLHYYVEATEKDVTQNRTQEFSPEVVPDAGACPNKGMVAAMAVVSKVVVGASAGATAAPAGFAANSVAIAGAAGGGGLGTTALVIGGVVVAGGAAAAVAAKGSDEQTSGPGPSASPSPDASVHVVEGIVYNDPCCGPGPIDPNIPRPTARRIEGAVVSSTLDSSSTTTDDRGSFRLTTQTRCQGSSGNYTLRITASSCDPLNVTRDWGCLSTGGPGGIPHALNLTCR